MRDDVIKIPTVATVKVVSNEEYIKIAKERDKMKEALIKILGWREFDVSDYSARLGLVLREIEKIAKKAIEGEKNGK